MLFRQWLNRPETLGLKGNWKYDDQKKQVVITLDQNHAGEYLFDVPVEIGIYKAGGNNPEIMKFRLDKKQNIYKIRLKRAPEKVVIAPATLLLAQIDFSG